MSTARQIQKRLDREQKASLVFQLNRTKTQLERRVPVLGVFLLMALAYVGGYITATYLERP